MSTSENTAGTNHQVPVDTYKCSQCNFYTNHEYYLQQHSLTHSLQVLTEQYKRSQFNYDSNNQVQAYIKSHNIAYGVQVPTKNYKCIHCNFETNQETYYEQHILTHNPQSPLDPYRIQPHKSFENEDDLYIKQDLNSVSTEQYNNRNFIREQKIDLKPRDLTQNTHNFDSLVLKQPELDCSLELFKCSYANCGFETFVETDLKQHFLTHEIQTPCPEVFRCTKCDFESHQDIELEQHMRQHMQNLEANVKCEQTQHAKEVFRCHNCDYETNFKAFLKRHILSNHATNMPVKQVKLETYKCQKCNFETKHEKFLKRHELSHKEKQYYKCKMCNFESLFKKMYVQHVKGHKTKKKPTPKLSNNIIKCDECSLEVGSKQQLEIHKKLRHTEKEVDNNIMKCAYCKYQTNWEPCLKRHIDWFHSDETLKKSETKRQKRKSNTFENKKSASVVKTKELFRCNNCDFSSTSKQYLILHLKRFHSHPNTREESKSNAKTFMCKLKNCLFVTSIKNCYLQHMIGHRKRMLLFFCDLCTFVSKKEEKLKLHKLKEHLIRIKQGYKCSRCNFKTTAKNIFKSHLSKHKKFTCNVCDLEVESAYGLVKHRRTHKDNVKNLIYLCDVCGFQSKNDRSLKMHKKTHNPEFKCPDCPFQTHSKVNFQNHCINHKSADEVTMFPCPHCSYQSRLKRNLAWHMKRHVDPSKAKIFKCPSCDYQTFTNAQLKSHLMVHKSKEEVMMLKCDFCPFETKRRSNMVQHRLRHLKDSPDVPLLSCPDCNYTTVAKRHLNKHRRTHTVNPDKMFQCSYCPFKIHRKVYLMRHMENHKNVDPMTNHQWQMFPYAPQSNMGVTIVPNLGQNF